MNKRLILLLILPLSLGACDDDYRQKTRTEFLTQGNWYLESARVSAAVNGQQYTENLASYLPCCMGDNALRFLPDGNMVVEEGVRACEDRPPSETVGTWQLVNNDRALRGAVAGLPELPELPTLPGLPDLLPNLDLQITDLDEKYLKLHWEISYQDTRASFDAVYSHRH